MKTKQALVSVVVPSYNHALYIERALLSVASQTYPNIELIVVDDGSTDGSQKLITKLISKIETKISSVFVSQKNEGAHQALNRGLQMATGQWLTILNSDDYFYPNRISQLINVAVKKKSELVMSLVTHVDEVGKTLPATHPSVRWYSHALAVKAPSSAFQLMSNNIAVTSGNLFFSRQLFEVLGGFHDYKLMHDYDFVLRAMVWTDPVLVKKKLMAYRVHSTNTITAMEFLNKSEAPQMVHDFLLNTILYPKPRNVNAPWAIRWKQEYQQFWLNNPRARLPFWLGPDGVRELFS